jgi:MFS family permease
MIPLVLLIPLQSSFASHKTALWCSLVVSCNLYNLANFQIFNCQYLLINNSVSQTARGKLNGIAMSISSFFKAIGPFVGGSLFAFTSTHNWVYPFNFSFVFNVVGLLFVGQFLIARSLAPSIEEDVDSKI